MVYCLPYSLELAAMAAEEKEMLLHFEHDELSEDDVLDGHVHVNAWQDLPYWLAQHHAHQVHANLRSSHAFQSSC